MNIPGENLKGIYSANEFLTRVNLMKAFSFPDYDTPVRTPKCAAVIGAGDTAMDAVRCAIRLGAEEGHIVYRRSETEKGARAEDYERARDEGVIFDWLTLPQRVLGDENGWVRGIECIRTELGEPDASGRRRPVPVPGSEFTLECDLVVIALGTNPNPLIPQTTDDIDVDGHGCIVADPKTGATSREGVFAGGDIVTGAATVILAMGAGRRAATAIHSYLQERAAKEGAAMSTTVGSQRDAELERGYAEGLDWAREFATSVELHDLVENPQPGLDDERWRGFIAGAEEVLRGDTEIREDDAPAE